MAEMTNSGSADGDGAFAERRDRFNRWRQDRPFAGGALLILASLVIAWIPINIAPDTILIGRALSPIGLLFAALVFLCGMFALTRPGLADIFGIFGGVFSVFSLYGALGGFGIGLVLGILGANLCYAWEDEEESEGGSRGSDETSEESEFDFDEESSDEDSSGLFGTRSRLTRAVSEPTTDSGSRSTSVALFVITIVVLGAFAHPILAAAAQPFPEQRQIDGTVVIAEQFSGQQYSHANVTTDTSNRESVPAGRLSFSSANIQGLTMYKNFRSGPGGPSHLTIRGSSASASNGLSLTVSEFYATELSLAGVVPLARNKWTTCPGQDFLLRVGDLGPLPGPPISGQGVTTNTHRLTAPSITIENLNLTMQSGTKSTSVQGTPECTRNPVEPVLDIFTASALELLAQEGQLPRTVLTNGTVSNLSAPSEVNQSETFTVSTTLTNTGYLNDTRTVEYRFDGAVEEVKNVTLGRNESTTVTFTDTAGNVSEGTYEYGIFANNTSVTESISVINTTSESDTLEAAENATNTSENETTLSPDASNETVLTQASTTPNGTASADSGNETTTVADENTAANESTDTTETMSAETTNTTDEGAGTETPNGTETASTTTPTTSETPSNSTASSRLGFP